MGAGLEVPRRRWVSGSVLFPARTRDANGASCYFNGARVCLAAGFPAAVGLASLFRDALLSRSSICSIPGCLVTPFFSSPGALSSFDMKQGRGVCGEGRRRLGNYRLLCGLRAWVGEMGCFARGTVKRLPFLKWNCNITIKYRRYKGTRLFKDFGRMFASVSIFFVSF